MFCPDFLRSCAVSALCLLGSAVSAGVPQYINPAGDEFPILAWYSILPDSAQTPERYRELREAGFNISFSHFKSNAQVERALGAMAGTGVRLMLTSHELVDDTEATVNRFKDCADVAGWFLRDEPTASGFPELRQFQIGRASCRERVSS